MFGSWFKRGPSSAELCRAELEGLQARFESQLAEITQTALEATVTGSPAWDSLMEAWGMQPDTEAQRRELAQGGFAQHHGAPYPEVREMLRRLEESTLCAWWDARDDLMAEHQALRQHVMKRICEADDAYAAAVKPRVEMGHVFANALQSSLRHGSKLGPQKHVTVRCKTCGSPRAHDDETLCRYCGHPLYATGRGDTP